MLIPVGIHAVADKYDVPCIYAAIAEDLRGRLEAEPESTLKIIIEAHYRTMMVAGGPVGELLASAVLKGDRKFMHTEEYRQLVLSNVAFGADMALALERDTVDQRCQFCSSNFTVRRDMMRRRIGKVAYCSYCQTSEGLPTSL